MNSIHLHYPIHRLQKIAAEDIPDILPQIKPEQPGYRIQDTNAVLVDHGWLTYLFCTNHEDRSYDLLHHVIASGEDPEPVFDFVLKHLGTLGFRRVRSIADTIRFDLDHPSPIKDHTTWRSFLEKLDAEADKMEHLYQGISHIDWVVPGPDYTLMLFCRDHKLRFLDVAPLMNQAPFHRIQDPAIFQRVIAYYGAVTWFPEDGGMEIDIDPDWCYDNGIVVDLFEVAQAIRSNNPVHSMAVLSQLETPQLHCGNFSILFEPEDMDQEFLELWLPDSANENFPLAPKCFYGNEQDMTMYMDAVCDSSCAELHQKRLTAYRQYCNGDTQAQVEWLSIPAPLFTKWKVEYQQQVCLKDVHWLHVDHHNRLVPLRAKRILLDQVILERNDEYRYCVRPTFEGLEQADYSLSRWMPVTKEVFGIANAIENRDGKFVSLLYMESGRYNTLCLALTAMEHPAQLDLRAVMDEFFGDFAF